MWKRMRGSNYLRYAAVRVCGRLSPFRALLPLPSCHLPPAHGQLCVRAMGYRRPLPRIKRKGRREGGRREGRTEGR